MRRFLLAAVGLALALGTTGLTFELRDAPSRLSDAEFWRLVTSFSEEGGYFPSDNFVSNETEYQTPIPTLSKAIKPGGVYVGVGPDQNFTYIVGLRPAIAFIVDIRRQNMLHHLIYKAVIEMSPTRADFMSRMFARARPKNLDRNATASTLMAAFLDEPQDPDMSDRILLDVMSRLTAHHRFTLARGDDRIIERVLRIFHAFGPDIAYAQNSGFRAFGGSSVRFSIFPGFADLMTRTDNAGVNHAYLADEGRYRVLREMHMRNAIVPVVGDFAGPKALRSVGDWARRHRSTIKTLYTSNVEQYLFSNGVWREYYANVATMPIDQTSTFIRAFFPSTTASGGIIMRPTDPPQFLGSPFGRNGGFIPSSSLVCRVQDLLGAIEAGAIGSYLDVIAFSK
jgi:hypothetical protein